MHTGTGNVSSFPTWGHPWGQMLQWTPQCTAGTYVLVGHKGCLPVPTVSCAHAGRDVHSPNPLCPVALLPRTQGYAWLHRTLQVRTRMTQTPPSPLCRQGHGWPQPPSAPCRCVPQAGRGTSGPNPLVPHADGEVYPHLTLCPVPQAGRDTSSLAPWFPCKWGGRGGTWSHPTLSIPQKSVARLLLSPPRMAPSQLVLQAGGDGNSATSCPLRWRQHV